MGLVSINAVRKSYDAKSWAVLIFVAAADFIFFEKPVGWDVGLFALFFLAFLAYYNGNALKTVFGKICVWTTFGEALLLAYHPNFISLALFLLGAIILSFLGKGFEISNALRWGEAIGRFLLSMTYVVFETVDKHLRVRPRVKKKKNKLSEMLSGWVLAVSFSIIFIVLFAIANPIIGNWFQKFDLKFLVPDISYLRGLFWVAAAIVFLPFLKPPRPVVTNVEEEALPAEKKQSWLFHKKSILNALAAFNFIFLFQTLSDLIYLWGGAGLPEGMSYATYAQQGAYPLMVTALLAAIFVLVALSSNKEDASDKWIRRLIYFWVVQNIFLVVSSILRTNLYIEQYSLTYLRFAALIWMGLVAVGLGSIIVCMVKQKTNLWLLNTNTVIVIIVLYICSMLNIGGIIAQYNVRNCYELTGEGVRIDAQYLHDIGTAALPAVRWLKEQEHHDVYKSLVWVETSLEHKVQSNLSYWRSWTFREYFISK